MMALLVRGQMGSTSVPVPSTTQVAIDPSATSSISVVMAVSSTFDMIMPDITETPEVTATLTEISLTPTPTLTTLSSASVMISTTSVSVTPSSTMLPEVTSTAVGPMTLPSPIATTEQVYCDKLL